MATKKRQGLHQEELTMWKAWQDDPKESKLEPLMNSLQRLVHYRVNEFKGAPVPQAAVRGFANAQVVKALNSYNPKRGASIGTHVNWHLKKVRSFVVRHQNLGKIPEHRAYNITKFKTARTDLEDEFGMAPDSLSLAERLGWSQKEVSRMESELEKRDFIASKNLEPDTLPDIYSAKERDALRYIHYDLTLDERLVFEYTLGLYGKPKLSATNIAKKMSISLPKVSRLRRKIDKKLRDRGV